MRTILLLLLPFFSQAQIFQMPTDTLFNDSTVSITTPQLPSQVFQGLQITLEQHTGTINANCYLFQSIDAVNYLPLGTDTFTTSGGDTIQSYIFTVSSTAPASIRCTCVGGDTQKTSVKGTYRVKRQ